MGALATAAAVPWPASAQAATSSAGPVLLTVTGGITRTNRGPFDPVLGQMMGKQKLSFEKARAFDFGSLMTLPAITIRPTLEYDRKRHALKGPLLTRVLQAAGATGKQLTLRAIDGYSPSLSLADADRYRFIVATHLDGKPMALGGLGPLWAVFDADRFPDYAAKPVDQRFALCPWGLYHIEVQG
nr:molybdopterin-dependent oxidoreductase [Ramlibacter aurantiacus]